MNKKEVLYYVVVTKTTTTTIHFFVSATSHFSSYIKNKMPSRFPPFDNSLTEDSKVVKLFVDKIQEKLDQKILTKPEETERKILENPILYPGAVVGAITTVASFAVLRRGPVYIVNRILARQHISKTSKPPIYEETNSLKIFGSIFDAAFASLLGVTAWFITIDKKKTLENVSKIPLIQGHSVISDCLCDDFISIYGGIRPKFWNEKSDDDTIMAIHTFVKNCEKRQVYKKRLKREMGLSYEDDVEFEFPSSVPDDIMEKESQDWADLEDFEEPLQNDEDDTFWDDK